MEQQNGFWDKTRRILQQIVGLSAKNATLF
jgi:hypothetical protein